MTWARGFRDLLKLERMVMAPGTLIMPEMFRRFGADEWDALRHLFRAAPARDAAE
jgi:hypothetical protein